MAAINTLVVRLERVEPGGCVMRAFAALSERLERAEVLNKDLTERLERAEARNNNLAARLETIEATMTELSRTIVPPAVRAAEPENAGAGAGAAPADATRNVAAKTEPTRRNWFRPEPGARDEMLWKALIRSLETGDVEMLNHAYSREDYICACRQRGLSVGNNAKKSALARRLLVYTRMAQKDS